MAHSLPQLENLDSIPLGERSPQPAAAFPREKIPKHAVLSLAALGFAGAPIPSVSDAGAVRYVNRGSMALGLALLHADVGAGDTVLLPAYHCISMIEPVVWRRATPAFYRINADTSANIEDIESRITPHTRALVVTHYFGFPQPIAELRALSDRHGLVLIEDCAHAWFGGSPESPIGSTGDYAIASAWKFFPVWDGGVLISRKRNLRGLALESGGLVYQAKAFVNTLEQAFEYHRLGVARLMLDIPLRLKDDMLRRMRRRSDAESRPVTALTHRLGGWGFEPQMIRRRMSRSSRAILALASKQRVAARRRANYGRMLDAFADLSRCRPLFPTLPQGVVPQVFPLLFEEPERDFPLLKALGVPIIRFGEFLWEGMDQSLCPVSADLSRRVFQLPCHQELTREELAWMIGTVRRVALGTGRVSDATGRGAAE